MVRGQTALAYLIMVAAILTIAVTAVVIFQSMLTPQEAANIVLDDKYTASLVGIELVDYQKPYNGAPAVSAPTQAVYQGTSLTIVPYYDHPAKHGSPIVQIGYNKAIEGKFKMHEEGSQMRLQSLTSALCELLYPEYTEENAGTVDAVCNTIPQNLPPEGSLSEILEITATAIQAGGATPTQLSPEGQQIFINTGLVNAQATSWVGGGGANTPSGPSESR